MTKLDNINDFLKKDKPLAVLGVSRNPKKFGRQVYKKLKSINYDLLPINNMTDEIDGDKCFTDIKSLPDGIEKLIILSPKEFNDEAIKEAHKKGINKIWVQQMCDTPNTLDLAEELNINIITNECIFMFA